MSDKFNMDGGVFSFLNKLFDVLFLSILWTLFCLPIITIGPSTTALYYTTAKVIRKDRGYVWHEFWHAFKTNFVTGAIYTVIMAAIVVIFYFGFAITKGTEDTTLKFVRYAYFLLVFFVGCGYTLLFPILSRFSLPKFQMLKMSFLISLKHFPVTFVVALIMMAGGTILFFVPALLLILPAVISLLCSLLIEPVFKRYLPKPEEGTPEEDLKWYQTF